MKRRLKRSSPASINITPLVDVLLILLAVMMLAMPLFVKRLPVDLPTTGLAGIPTPIKALQVAILADGSVLVEGSPLVEEGLKRLIKPDTTIELSIDKAVTYETIAQVVSSVQSKQPKEVILITR